MLTNKTSDLIQEIEEEEEEEEISTPDTTVSDDDPGSQVIDNEPGSATNQPPVNPGQPKDGEESFFDPKTLPEELLPAYKQMQAAFTKKTQTLAEERKQAEQWKQQADKYGKVEHLLPIVEEMLATGQKQPTQAPELAALATQLRNEGYSEEAIKLAMLSGQTLLNTLQQKDAAKAAEATTKAETERITNGIAEAGKVDARLNDNALVYSVNGKSMTFGQIVERYVASDPSWQKDPVAATKEAIALVDSLIGQAKLDGKQELSASAQTKAKRFPPVNSSPRSSVSNAQPATIKEAFKLAKEELGI